MTDRQTAGPRRTVIERHSRGDRGVWIETVECAFCGDDLRGRQLADHLLTCPKADREVSVDA